jgi:hypothetical protein
MNRRNFITTVAAASTAVSLAGCIGGSNGPEGVAKSYLNAVFDGDYEKAQSFAHEDVNGELTRTFVTEQSSLSENGDVSIEGTTVTEETETEAVVEIVVGFQTTMGPMTTTSQFDLVKIDGDWLVTNRTTV